MESHNALLTLDLVISDVDVPAIFHVDFDQCVRWKFLLLFRCRGYPEKLQILPRDLLVELSVLDPLFLGESSK